DHVAVLDPDRGDELPAPVDPLDVRGAVCQLDLVRIQLVRHPADRVELRHRLLFRTLVVLGRAFRLADVDDEERRVQPALAHLRQVDLEVPPDAGVHLLGRVVEGDVDVRVEGEDAVVDLARPGDDLVLRDGGRAPRDGRRATGRPADRT